MLAALARKKKKAEKAARLEQAEVGGPFLGFGGVPGHDGWWRW